MIKVEGLKELNKALKQLGPRAARNALRASIRAGGRVVVSDARKRLPPQYDTLKRSLSVKVNRQRSPYEITAEVGPTTGKSAKYDGWYAHLVEFGVAPHEITPKTKQVMVDAATSGRSGATQFGTVFGKKVQHPGVPAKPFLTPAFEQNKRAIIEAQRKKLWEAIRKQAAKLKK